MKWYLKIIFVLSLCGGLLFMVGTFAVAAESVTATIETNQIAVDEAVQLTITVEGSNSAARPEINSIDGLSIQYRGTSNQVQIINGKYSSQLSYNYSVVALKPGQYTLGPFEIMAGDKKLHTNSLQLTVTGSKTGKGPSDPAGSEQDQEAINHNQLYIDLGLPKTTIYQGEVLPLTIKLLVRGISVDEISYPNLTQAEFVLGKMAKPLQTQEIVGGLAYKVLEFHTTLTPVKTGTIALGPVTINCNVLVRSKSADPFFDDFFPNMEKQSVQVKSKKISINVLPVPLTGKPANFSGGIGQFRLQVSATPLTVIQGDPITVKMLLSGKGNFRTVNAPVLKNSAGLKVYAAQRKNSTDQGGNSGEVTFEQVLIPVDSKINQIDPYVFTYFDPVAGLYQQIVTPPIPLSVKVNPNFNNSAISDDGTKGQGEQLGHDLVFIKDSPGQLRLTKDRFYYQVWFWILQLLPLIGLVAALSYHGYRKMLQSDTPASRDIRASNQANKQLEKVKGKFTDEKWDELLDELHLVIRTYLAQKYQKTAAGMTGDVVETLRNEGIAASVLEKITHFFTTYDFYRFTGAKVTADDAHQMWETVNQIIGALNQQTNGSRSNRFWAGKERNINENK